MKRSRGVIILHILKICVGGASKNEIIHQANLNSKTAKPYTDSLSNNGLLKVRQGQRIIYETTDKGIGFIEKFNGISNKLSER